MSKSSGVVILGIFVVALAFRAGRLPVMGAVRGVGSRCSMASRPGDFRAAWAGEVDFASWAVGVGSMATADGSIRSPDEPR